MPNQLQKQAEKIYRHARQGSIDTKREYRKCFYRFLNWLWMNYRVKKLSNISNRHLRDYVRHLFAKGCSADYIYKMLSAIRYFHDQLPAPRYKLERCNSALGAPKRETSGDRAWTREEYEYLKQVAEEKNLHWVVSLLVLMWELGLRVHEAVRMYRVDIERALACGYLRAKGKGGKERYLKLSPKAEQELLGLKKSTPRGARVFVREGEKAHRVIFKFQKFLRDHRPDREGENLTSHGLRYSYAQRKYYKLKSAGLPVREVEKKVSRELGHNRPSVTRGYVGK